MHPREKFELLPRESLMKSRFTEIRNLGEGSFGTVHLVADMLTKKQCVVKRNKGKMSSRDIKSAMSEIETLKSLQHQNIVEFYLAWVDADEHLHIGMEFCEGGDLERFLFKNFPIPENTIRSFTVQLLQALDYMHQNHIIHRDMKLTNILLADSNIVKIADFGLAKIMITTDAAAMTQAGTPYFFSPEVAAGRAHTRKTDIWSLGVVLFQLMTKKLPFKGRGIADVLKAITISPTPDITRVLASIQDGPTYTAELCSTVMRMMSKDPDSRPTAEELLAEPWIKSFSATETASLGLSNGGTQLGIEMVFTRESTFLNIRKEMSTSSEVIGKLQFGDIVRVLHKERVKNVRGEAILKPMSSDDPPPQAPEIIVWLKLCFPVSGYCIGEIEGEPVFQRYEHLPPRLRQKDLEAQQHNEMGHPVHERGNPMNCYERPHPSPIVLHRIPPAYCRAPTPRRTPSPLPPPGAVGTRPGGSPIPHVHTTPKRHTPSPVMPKEPPPSPKRATPSPMRNCSRTPMRRAQGDSSIATRQAAAPPMTGAVRVLSPLRRASPLRATPPKSKAWC